MTIWSAEIKELTALYESLKGKLPDLEKELDKLVKADDENMVLIYSRRCLEVIVNDLCESELKRPRKTEPLKGVIDKLNKEEKVPANIVASMHNLNTLSTFGAHPKDFDPRQVKPVLNNLTTIIEWYLKYKETQTAEKTKPEEAKHEGKEPEDSTEVSYKQRKSLLFTLSGLLLVCIIVIVALMIFNVIGGGRKAEDDVELEKSIAVLPLENMSDGEEFSHLGDAITDEIIMQLYKINAFEVRSRTSVMQYKNTEKTSPIIGKELNVNYLLEGSTQRYENQVRIRVQLIHASTDAHIWGNVFVGEWKDIFDIQINMAKQVAYELKTVLSPDEIRKIEKNPTENHEAYNLYLQGRHFWVLEGKDNLDKSIEYYKRALEIDPDYALAYAGMATTYNSYAWWGYSLRRDFIPLAKEAAMNALEIDNTLGEAHTELAFARLVYDWDWSGSEKEFKRALELNPSNARAHNLYAWLLTNVGRLDEAIKESKRAYELDPLSLEIWVELGRRYYFTRDYDTAIEIYQQVLEVFPNASNSWYARSELALALSQKGLHNEAIDEYSKIEFEPTYHWHLGYIYGVAGKREKAMEILNNYLELLKKEFVWTAGIAIIYIGLNEKDKAFEWLEKTYDQREGWLTELKIEPMYDRLRSDPRFQDLLKRMNFPD